MLKRQQNKLRRKLKKQQEHEEAEERRKLELFFTKQTTPEETRNEEEMAEISYNHGLFGKSKERRGCSAYRSGISTSMSTRVLLMLDFAFLLSIGNN
jgi:hypothetical protein